MARNLTEGKPIKLLLAFFLPIMLGNLFQQLYNMADTLIVGRTLGVGALAAVGSTGSLNFMIIGFTFGLSSGLSICVARAFGAGDLVDVRRYVANLIYLAAGIAIILTVVTTLLCRPVLELMQTPPDIIDDAYNYLFVILAGIGATMLYNVVANIARAIGDSRTPLIFLIIASVINVVLDLVFIIVLHMGVRGASIATVIAQLISGVACTIYLFKRYPILHVRGDEWKPELRRMRELLGNGLPMAFQFSITAIGSIILQSATNSFGSTVVAAITAGGKVYMLLNLPLEAMGAAMATYTSQNLGARKLDRIRAGVRGAILCTSAFATVGCFVAVLFGRYIVRLFIDAGSAALLDEILVLTQQYFFANGIFFWLLGILLVLRNSLQGMGYALPAMAAGLFELVARVVTALVLVPWLGYTAVCLGNPTAWIFATAFLVPMYFYAVKRLGARMGPVGQQ